MTAKELDTNRNELPPYVQVKACYMCRTNKLYRVYLGENDWYFLYAGSGDIAGMIAGAHGGGLLGALIMTPIVKRANDKIKRLEAQLESLKLDDLESVATANGNFTIQCADISSLTIGPPTFWHRAKYNAIHAGIVRCIVRDRGRFLLEVPTIKDMNVAIRELPRRLGNTVSIAVEWNESKNKFVAAK